MSHKKPFLPAAKIKPPSRKSIKLVSRPFYVIYYKKQHKRTSLKSRYPGKIATGGINKRQAKKKPVTRRDWLFPGEKRYLILSTSCANNN